jgi:leader peptidase (prepilin peptidase)/N-methyltransferase
VGAARAEPGPLRWSLRALVAALTAASVIVDLRIHHATVNRVLGAVLLVVLGIVTVTDIEQRRIPNRIVAPAAVCALVLGGALHPSGIPAQVVAGVCVGAFLLLFAIVSGGGLGMGDVKLGLVLGLFLGAEVILALVVGLLASAVYALWQLARYGLARGRRVWIPMGPFLALGGAVAVLAGSAAGLHWGA